LRFAGGMPLGLFRGVRTYDLSPDGNGGVTFAMREEYPADLLERQVGALPGEQT
jgi:hypothetical protein